MSNASGQSEQQSETTTTPATATNTSVCSHPEAVGTRWGDPISQERQAELRGYLDQWQAETDHGERKGPFDKMHDAGDGVLLTGADVSWLAEQSGRDEFGWVPNLHLECALLSAAHLEGALLSDAHLEGALLGDAYLEHASLRVTHLENAFLNFAHLEHADLTGAHLEHTSLFAHLEHADLIGAHLEDAGLNGAHLEHARLYGAHLEHADLREAHLEYADLREAYLDGTELTSAHLEGANLSRAHLEGKTLSLEDLERIHQWVPDFPEYLAPADLRLAFLNEATTLNGICLGDTKYDYVQIADVRWGGVNLAVVELPPAHLLGDEREAQRANDSNGKPKDRTTRLDDYRAAVRANRQLAVALRNLGLNEEADHFAYRAQFLQQQVLRRQRKVGGYFFSRMLDGLAGYGYKPVRGLIAYLTVIVGFAFAYGLATHGTLTFGLVPSSIKPLQWYEALVLSISSFHGRGFFQPVQSLGDPVAIIAAAEAIIGLLIEISFIATFTQRFFGR
jgi:uncharacterized protein YjbI with pentapeptide repeats